MLVEIALDDAIELVERELDAVIADAILRIVVGADLRAALAGADLSSLKVVAYGACASSGGPYWDSYCVTRGAHLVVPVDVWVPGCPPRPEGLIYGVMQLQKKIRGEAMDDFGTPLPMVEAWTR